MIKKLLGWIGMGILSSLLLAVSLSIDSLGIGISYGLRKIKVTLSAKIIISIISIIFTSSALFIGSLILTFIDPFIAKLIGSAMLAVLGFFIIYQALKKEPKPIKKTKEKKDRILNFMIKPFKITVKITKDPITSDLKNSQKIDSIEAIYLGVALSIDAFTAGLSSVVSGLNSFLIPIFVAVCQLIFLSFGHLLGRKFSIAKNINTKIFVFASGLMLILLSLIRFFL